MQYLVSVINDTGDLATPEEMAAIDTFNAGLQADGHWVFAGGLASADSATVIDNRAKPRSRSSAGHRVRLRPGSGWPPAARPGHSSARSASAD